MDEDTYSENLKTLKESILDEEKLVTYISLSKDFCIHVNEAKSLLTRATKEIRETEHKSAINVCYMVSGLLDDGSARTTVCSEADIEDIRKTLRIKFFEHIYCVSQGVQGVDNVALAAINKFEDFSLCTGLIKANSCSKRTGDEINNLKSNSNVTTAIHSKPQSNDNIKKDTRKPREITSNIHKVVSDDKSEAITNFKHMSPSKNVCVNSNKINISKKGAKPIKGIAGFFNKINGDSIKTKNVKLELEHGNNEVMVKIEEEMKIKEHSSDQILDDFKKDQVNGTKSKSSQRTFEKVESTSRKAVKIENETKTYKSNQTPDKIIKKELINKSETKPSTKSLKQIKKNGKVDKKRKRVLHVSDSESDMETNDPFDDDDSKIIGDNESEDEIPPTPSINTVKITSGIVNPKKRRKIVDKTYTDEDGYILTKKEEVYESCSDNEVEIKVNTQEKENAKQTADIKIESPPKTNSKNKKKKISPPQKGKQQMLTNFFKKV